MTVVVVPEFKAAEVVCESRLEMAVSGPFVDPEETCTLLGVVIGCTVTEVRAGQLVTCGGH